MKKKNIINEIMGVPSSLNAWVDYFGIITTGMAKAIIQSEDMDMKEAEVTDPNNENDTIIIDIYRGSKIMSGDEVMDWVMKIGGFDNLTGILRNENFRKFPLYKPTIKMVIYVIPDEVYELQTREYADSNIMASYDWYPDTIKISKLGGDNKVFIGQHFTFETYLPFSSLEPFNDEDFRKKLKPTISHELTHAYETYKRLEQSGDPFTGREGFLNRATELASAVGEHDWNDFLHMVYLSLSTEINARVVQLYNHMNSIGVTTKDEFMNELKKNSVWGDMMMLKNFNADNFLKNFENIDDGNYITSKINNWDRLLTLINDKYAKMIGGTYKGKFMDKVPQSAKENPIKFFKFFEKRFHKKAEDFRRKLLKLSSLVLNNDIIKESIDEFDWVDEISELSPAEQFIYDKLKSCQLIESKKQPGWTKYIDKMGNFLFLDNIDTGTKEPVLYADYDKIWLKCEKMGMNYKDFQKACVRMLYETHKRKVSTASFLLYLLFKKLYETHKRKVSTANTNLFTEVKPLYETHKRKV